MRVHTAMLIINYFPSASAAIAFSLSLPLIIVSSPIYHLSHSLTHLLVKTCQVHKIKYSSIFSSFFALSRFLHKKINFHSCASCFAKKRDDSKLRLNRERVKCQR